MMQIEISFILNNKVISTKVNPGMVLLDFIRKNQQLTGTKEVCKEGDCGACAVMVGDNNNRSVKYKTINSCIYPIQKVKNKHVVTIEGLNQVNLTPIQYSFLEEGSSQCGFCTPGFIISFTNYLLNNNKFNIEDAINAVAGNICRCTGYQSIKRSLSKTFEENSDINLNLLIDRNFIPNYFDNISNKLSELSSNTITSNIYTNQIQFISGGTDLFVQQPEELLKKNLELIENIIPQKIEIVENKLNISGSTTVNQFAIFIISQKIDLSLKKLIKLFASLPIRNSATIAGNIINASPIADITIFLLALNAELTLRNSLKETRRIFLNDFYLGYKTLEKSDDEIIEQITIELPDLQTLFNFEKVSKRTYLDIASVNTALSIKIVDGIIKGARLSAGGVSPVPLYLKSASNFLIGKNLSNETILKTIEIALNEISPISDIRGSKEYKSLLLSQLIKAHFIDLFPNIIKPEVLI